LLLIAPPGLLSDALARSLALVSHELEVRQSAGTPDRSVLARSRLIVLDADLAGSDALLAELRARTAAPIVALVTAADQPSIATTVAHDAATWVSKTLSEAHLLDALRRVLGADRQDSNATGTGQRKPRDGRACEEGQARPYGLTASELDVLRLLAEGLTNRQIAGRRRTTEGTVKVHLDKVYRKLQVQNRAQAILIARRVPMINDLQIQRVEQDGFRVEWLLPYTEAQIRKPGDVLFHKGDPGDALYYIQRGRVALVELGVQLADGSVLGEIGIFSPAHQRTSTAQCEAETRLFRLDAEHARRLYVENPQFAYHVLRLISGRLIADRQRSHSVH
jgi:DNA-binding NarL/FixJ family response regulator